MKNIETIQNIYAAFGRGDVAAVLAPLAAHVTLDAPLGGPITPWLQPQSGPAGFAQFLAALFEHTEMISFVPKNLLESEGVVVALVDLELRVKKTGQIVREIDEAHVWRFDDRGQVVSMKHCADTHQHARAFEGR